MIYLIITGIYLVGIVLYKCLCTKHKLNRNKNFYVHTIYWIVLLFSTSISIILYFNIVEIGDFFENMVTAKSIGIFISVLVLLILFQMASPSHSFHKSHHKPAIEKNRSSYSEQEYEGFLKIISVVLVMTIMLCTPIFYLIINLNYPFGEQIQMGLLCGVGISLVILLPLCIRQIIYYIFRIKHLQSDESIVQNEISCNIVENYIDHSHRML